MRMVLAVSVGLFCTLSAVAQSRRPDTPALIEKADQALYSAKQAGRNTVRVADMRGVGARRE